MNVKRGTDLEAISENYPDIFAKFIYQTRKIGFTDKPAYGHYRKEFKDKFKELGYHHDHEYDWTILAN